MKKTQKEKYMEKCYSTDILCNNPTEIDKPIIKDIKNNDKVKLDNIEKDFIIAGQYSNKYTIYDRVIYIQEKINNLDYLNWKLKKLKRLKPKFKQVYNYDQNAGRNITKNVIYFSLNEEMISILDNKKNEISPFCLSLIVMDNGTFENNRLILDVKHLNIDTVEYFIKYITGKHLKCYPNIDNYVIIFKNESLQKLKNAIYPFMFHKMKYKIGEEYNNLPICIVSKTVVFDSAHFLDEYDGKCNNLHGGRYELTVYIRGPINPDTGMVIDFTYLKKILKNKIVDKFDHHCLNYTVPQLAWRSTTELICIYIWQRLIKYIPSLYKIELKETPNSKCEYMGEGLENYNHQLDLLNLNR